MYLRHRFGFVLFISVLTFLIIIPLETRSLDEMTLESALFWWGCGALLLPIPLMGGWSYKEARKLIALSSLIFIVAGILSLAVSTQLVVRIISSSLIIITIIFGLIKRKKHAVFNLKPRINFLMFLESLGLLAISGILSSAIIFFEPKGLVESFSSGGNYFLLMLTLYISLSLMMTIFHTVIKDKQSLRNAKVQ